jgi:hypothetical protein
MQKRIITVSKLFKQSICSTTDKCSDPVLWTVHWMYEFVMRAGTDLLTITHIAPSSATCHSNPSTALHWIKMWKTALPTK